jgi:hypothetical protein
VFIKYRHSGWSGLSGRIVVVDNKCTCPLEPDSPKFLELYIKLEFRTVGELLGDRGLMFPWVKNENMIKNKNKNKNKIPTQLNKTFPSPQLDAITGISPKRGTMR